MPMIAKMKKKSTRTLPTLTSAGSENSSVCSSVRNPRARRTSLSTLATLNTRSIAMNPALASVDIVTMKPTRENPTTVKSNLFHGSSK